MDKKRILIVDDEPGFTRMVKLNLEKTGAFEVREENRALGAIPSAREFKPDLILLDVVMPSMDGGDVYSQIQHDRRLRDIPVVFLTAAVTQSEAGVRGLTSGGALFLAKPVSVENLIHCINDHIAKSAEAKQAKSEDQA